MEPPPAISPFVFVDGRKYILAETEERPEPEIFGKLTPPPRTVSPLVRWRVLLRSEMELLLIVLCMGTVCTVGILYLLGGDFAAFAGFLIVPLVPLLPIAFMKATKVILTMRQTTGIIWLLQNGLAGKGRFFGMGATGKTVDNFAEVQLQYQFTTEDGNTRNAFFVTAEIKKAMALADESFKLIFYDPAQPNRNLLFDSLPKGIVFDEFDGIFRTSPMLLYVQILWLCFVFAVVPAIIFVVATFLC